MVTVVFIYVSKKKIGNNQNIQQEGTCHSKDDISLGWNMVELLKFITLENIWLAWEMH